MADLIQFRRDTEENWEKFNPILAEGELGFVLDNKLNRYKIGDGITPWKGLPLSGFNGNIINDFGESENAVVSQKFFTEIILSINETIINVLFDIKTLKDRNNAEIPTFSGVVESATIQPGSVIQYSGVYFIESEGRFAAKKGSEYFANWIAYGGYQAQQVYHQDNKAVPNRLYNLIALSGGGLHYFDGTTFKVVNDNAGVEQAINAYEEAIAALQQTIQELTARIEALEKSGGSVEVEDGTLSASASVVNDVMSVQGSVIDGILKL